MAGITDQGLLIKTSTEVYNSFTEKLRTRVDPLWDDKSNNLINIFSGILADEISDAWLGFQGAYDASYPKSASGINLDNVSDIVNVQRIEATNSQTPLEFTGSVCTVIPATTIVTVDGTDARFATVSSLTLSATQFSDVTIQVTAIANSTAYSLTINNVVITITSDASATAAEIVTALKAAIDAASLGVTTSLPTSTTLRVNVTEVNSVYPLVVGARLGITSVSDIVDAEAEEEGEIQAPVNSLINLLVPIVGITSVTNNEEAKQGRLRETDSELRTRRYESVAIIGASTESAITANVKNLDGVTAAFIISNRTFTTDVDGRPPKSFEVVVEGGDEDSIAETIWRYHPAGIESYGNITKTIVDDDDITQTIKFSRPEEIYIKMQIDYTKYDEEAFGVSGEEGIKQAALAYGETLNIGVDVIPQRFYGTIFSSVSGISSLAITLSSSTDGISWTPYSSTPVSVGKTQRSNFDITNINVTEV